MKETGIVKSVEGELCTCAVMRKSACGENCASCKAACESREHTFVAKNKAGAKAGDAVIIEMGTGTVLASAFLVYILPLAAFLIGFAAFENRGKNEILSAVFGVIIGGAVWFLVSLYSKKKKAELMPEVTEIV